MSTTELQLEAILNQIAELREAVDLSNQNVLNLDKLVAYTGIAKDTVYKYTRNHSIPHSKQGGKLYFSKKEIDAWLLREGYGKRSI